MPKMLRHVAIHDGPGKGATNANSTIDGPLNLALAIVPSTIMLRQQSQASTQVEWPSRRILPRGGAGGSASPRSPR